MFNLASPHVLVVVYCLLALVAALAGGWLPTLLHLTHSRLQVAISMVAGLMLGLSLLHLLPHSVHELDSVERGVSWLMSGFLVMFLLQRFLPFHQHDVPEEEEEGHPRGDHDHHHNHAPVPSLGTPLGWVGVALGLSFHSIFDGLALAAAVTAESRGHGLALGFGTALAVILHKPFSAMAITTLMTASRAPRRWHHLINVGFALVTPLGAVLFYLGAGPALEAQTSLLGAALAFCAGTFLCIACADLLPELQFHSHDRIKLSLALGVGLGFAILIGKVGHGEHDHDHETPAVALPADATPDGPAAK